MRDMKNTYRYSPAMILRTFAIYGFAIALLSACGDSTPESPEARVKHTLELMEQAAEKRSLSDFMQHVSDSYKDHQGNTKADIRRLIQLQYLQHQNIYIFTSVQSLDVSENLATVEVSAAMAANEPQVESQQARLRADTHRFSIVLRSPDEQQTWLVDSVSWERGWAE
jgi:hypothetical protein